MAIDNTIETSAIILEHRLVRLLMVRGLQPTFLSLQKLAQDETLPVKTRMSAMVAAGRIRQSKQQNGDSLAKVA